MPPRHVSNTLLRSLPDCDLELIRRYARLVELPRGAVLAEPHRISDYTFFPDSGLASVRVLGEEGHLAEVCLVGREGCAPFDVLYGASTLPFQVVTQHASTGVLVPNAMLATAMLDRLSVRNSMIRFAQAAAVQTAYTAYTNANMDITQRLARWLLMCHDRLEGDAVDVTHHFLARTLSTRRQSVTTALHVLEGEDLILSVRKRVRITNREGLEARAGASYGVPERQYRALLGEAVTPMPMP